MLASVLFVALATGTCWGLHAVVEVRWVHHRLSRVAQFAAQLVTLLVLGLTFAVAAGCSSAAFWRVSIASWPLLVALPALSLASGALLIRQVVGDRVMSAPLLLAVFWVLPAVSAPDHWVGRVLHSALDVHACLRCASESSSSCRDLVRACASASLLLLPRSCHARPTMNTASSGHPATCLRWDS